MAHWEYKILSGLDDDGNIKGQQMDVALNELGREGWELVLVNGFPTKGNPITAFILKRPVAD